MGAEKGTCGGAITTEGCGKTFPYMDEEGSDGAPDGVEDTLPKPGGGAVGVIGAAGLGVIAETLGRDEAMPTAGETL